MQSTNSHLIMHLHELADSSSEALTPYAESVAVRRPVLIVDDEPQIRNLLKELLTEDYICTVASSAEEAISYISKQKFDVLISDINLGGMTGVDMIPLVSAIDPDMVVLMISGDRTIDSAIGAMRVGAFDYLKKPFDFDQVLLSVRSACRHHLLLDAKRRHETEREQLVAEGAARLNYLAYHDELTHLPNRPLFEDRFLQAVFQIAENQIIATTLLSIDRFNIIRDSLGHEYGNQILVELAERLEKHSGNGTTAARFDGDEFAVLISRPNMDGILEVAENILRDIRLPFYIAGEELFITPSIGISVFREVGTEIQTLLKYAGAALSRVREEGGNNYKFYTSEMNLKALKRLSLDNDLRRAVERSEFKVYYQPKIDTASRRIVGTEALIRWQHPALGLISPDEFIPAAEETGLIAAIGEWILRAACVQTKLWHDEGHHLNIAVNLSAMQFKEKDLAEVIAGIIEESGLDPHFLNLEITETCIMENPADAFETLSRLKAIGVKISIDDFGTGYSSLGYLKKLPIDVLKIDRTFIRDLTNSPDDRAMVSTILTLAHNLNLEVVAEGVETEGQLAILKTMKCDEWQGYLCSEPVNADSLMRLLLTVV